MEWSGRVPEKGANEKGKSTTLPPALPTPPGKLSMNSTPRPGFRQPDCRKLSMKEAPCP